MAVIIKYIVVRNGVEKMTFTTKKEADAYDKMLDISDNLYAFIESSGIDMEENIREDIALFLAENKDKVTSILKGGAAKTITQESADALASDPAFQIGQEAAKTNQKKRKVTQIYAKQKEMEMLKEKVEELENLIFDRVF